MSQFESRVLAQVLGVPVQRLVPIENAMARHHLVERNGVIGLWATVKTETGSILPLEEAAPKGVLPEVYFKKYDNRRDLGNNQPGDGLKFRGHGYVQLTGRANHELYGGLTGFDLVNHPELAMQPAIAADVLCLYMLRSKAWQAALMEDWERCRRRVNGGTNGLDTFLRYVNLLRKVA